MDPSGLLSNELGARLRSRSDFDARYELLEELGRGSMGVVYRVRDRDLNRVLAMKVLARTPSSDQERGGLLARFLEEAQLNGRLDHPGIVPVHELGLDSKGRVYFTMKLVEGRTLAEVLQAIREQREGWTPEQALPILLRAAEAVAYAHSKGIVHRDLKPGNVMIGSFGEVYVVDWGLARVLSEPDRRDLRLAVRGEDGASISTLDGTVIGTPAYMPPEQAGGRVDEIGPPSDVYALGAMLYHLLAGHMPYEDRGSRAAHAVVAQVLSGPPTALEQRARLSPPELIAIASKAMAREPADRYPDVAQFVRDLEAFLNGQVVRAYETGAFAESRKWVQRHPRIAALFLGAMVLLVVGLAVVLELKSEAQGTANKLGLQLQETETERDRILGLSDLGRWAELSAEERELWPPYPTLIPRMERWLQATGELASRLPQHRLQRDSLRSTDTQRNGIAGPSLAGSSVSNRWLAGQFDQLVRSIEELTQEQGSSSRVRAVEARLAQARSIEHRSLGSDAARTAWDQALQELADTQACPQYAGLTLSRALGYLPLGRDPRSGLLEFAHLASGQVPQRDERGEWIITSETGIILVLVPRGQFYMGASPAEREVRQRDPAAQAGESPVHEVRLEAYLCSKYELTRAQWQRAMGGKADDPSLPATELSWLELAEFARRMDLELLTEAQWEHAARALRPMPWWSGRDEHSLRGVENLRLFPARNSSVLQVGSLEPNPWGFYDMLGNVAEWCRDADAAYELSVQLGDGARLGGDPDRRMVRGGSYESPATEARVSARRAVPAPEQAPDIGARLGRRLWN